MVDGRNLDSIDEGSCRVLVFDAYRDERESFAGGCDLRTSAIDRQWEAFLG
jgi:hypothetical protein